MISSPSLRAQLKGPLLGHFPEASSSQSPPPPGPWPCLSPLRSLRWSCKQLLLRPSPPKTLTLSRAGRVSSSWLFPEHAAGPGRKEEALEGDERDGPDPSISSFPGGLSDLLRRHWPLQPGLRQWINCDFGGCQAVGRGLGASSDLGAGQGTSQCFGGCRLSPKEDGRSCPC